MKRKIFLVWMHNGMKYDDHDAKIMQAFTTQKQAERFIKENPITAELYIKTFNYGDFSSGWYREASYQITYTYMVTK